jgi:hypothetical protein
MEQRILARNAIAQHGNGQSTAACAEFNLRTQVAALEATIAFCQTHRQQHEEKAKALDAICTELELRKGRPN